MKKLGPQKFLIQTMLRLDKRLFSFFIVVIFNLQISAQDISAELFNSTIKIFAYNEGKGKIKQSIGTGFFFIFKTSIEEQVFIITNKHVIKNFSKGKIKFNELSNNKNYNNQIEVQLSNFSNLWIMHPTEDVAILPFFPIQEKLFSLYKKRINVKAFSEDLILKENEDTTLNALLDVLMIGYPKGFYDTINNIPIIRKGLTATPVYTNYNNQKRFLVDIPIFQGSSGSPIVLYNESSYSDKKGNFIGGKRLFLLGIATEAKEYKSVESSIWLPLNIALVIKASVILDLKEEALKKTRNKTYRDLFFFSLTI